MNNSCKVLFVILVLVVQVIANAQNTKQHLTSNQTTHTMTATDYTTSFVVDQTPEEVFKGINNVRGWWSESVEGKTDQLNEEFLYYYKDVHIAKMKIVEFVPGKKVVWLVLKNEFNFTKDKSEWNG